MGELQIGVAGVTGQMGTMLVRQIAETPGCRVAAGSVRPGNDAENTDIGTICGIGPVGLPAIAVSGELFAQSSVVIDFTLPGAIPDHAAAAKETGTAWVVGMTGLDDADESILADAARSVPVVFAPNMSLGINLLFGLVEQVARVLDDGFDIEVFEIHHNRKIDAPSGTALGLGRAAAKGRNVDFDDAAVLSREGHTGARERGKIGFAALRGGDIVGDHSVTFAGAGERVEITHRAAGRHIYAAGAVRAALWSAGREPGLYNMADVLGLKT